MIVACPERVIRTALNLGVSSAWLMIHSLAGPRPLFFFWAVIRPSRHHSWTVNSALLRIVATSAVEYQSFAAALTRKSGTPAASSAASLKTSRSRAEAAKWLLSSSSTTRTTASAEESVITKSRCIPIEEDLYGRVENLVGTLLMDRPGLPPVEEARRACPERAGR